jgi:Ca2+-binding EF-hand superfamily protein
LIDKPIYLYSEPSSINRYSKVSRLQEVTFMLKNNFNTIWILEHPDPNQRLESTGRVIGVDETVLVKHEMTNQWLAADNKLFENTFGKEYEVMAHNFLVNSKSQNLSQEKKGVITIDTPSRSQTDENLWLVLGASSPEQEFDESLIKNEVVNRFTLEKKMKHLLTERGVYGMRFLHKVFRCLDADRQGSLDENDFRWGLQSGKIFLSEEELAYLIKTYSAQDRVSYHLFLNDLRGKLNENRYKSIIEAYKRVEKVTGKKMTLEEMGKIYDAKRHPEVLTAKKTEKEAFNEFVWSWDNIKPDYAIELEEFAAYFEDLSCMIPRDDHFEYLLLSVFHL